MVSLEAQDLAYEFASAYTRYMRILDEEPDLFKQCEKKDAAFEVYQQRRKTLFNYIADLEAKAGVE